MDFSTDFQWGMILGLFLCTVLGVGLHFGSRLFTKDADVLHLIHIGIPFVALTQPINALAFVFDGINYGASDFAYAAYSMASPSGHHKHYLLTHTLRFALNFLLRCMDRNREGALDISSAFIIALLLEFHFPIDM
ncbi:Protein DETOXIFICATION 42 [Ananas comosus]|uniref:Protein DETOXIFICATION 42 n=1 Tax=Ananas comosus TaxID=4615 RepID=A0A199UD89_ANACO|nr:Protein DETOXIFICATION 42 [Ananas comosus]